jgi:glycosyltransferase involved in cell wall biosynthesis
VASSESRPRERTGVLLVVPWDQRFGGVNTVVRLLARRLVDTGCQPTFLFPGDSVVPRSGRSSLGYNAYWMNLRPVMVRRRAALSLLGFALSAPLVLAYLLRMVHQHGIGVVNAHYQSAYMTILVALRRLAPIRLVTSIHGSDHTEPAAGPLERWSRLFLLRHSDVVIAPSEAFAESIRQAYPAVARKVVTIPNGIDVEALRSMASTSDPDAPDAAIGPDPYIACVAAFIPKKAHDTLLRAFAAVSGPVRLVLVGDGPLRQEILRLIDECELGDRVVLMGVQPPEVVARVLARAVCSVLPSRNEPFGIAAVESMALGTPVVTSGVGGLSEICIHEETGLVFPVDDVVQLTAALNRITSDVALRERLGTAGRMRAQMRYGWRAMASRYMELAYSPGIVQPGTLGGAGSSGPATPRHTADLSQFR